MDQQHLDKYLKMATALRAAGINTEVYLETAKLGNQLTYADRKGFRLALIAGETEFASDQVQIKDLSSKQQHMIATDRVVSAVKELLRMA
jgi:histidyl-tRNA synthetase